MQAIQKLVAEARTENDKELKAILSMECGVICDVVKVEEAGELFYSFISHYFLVSKYSFNASFCPKCEMKSRPLFLEQHNGYEAANAFRTYANQKLRMVFDTSFVQFEKHCTSAIQCASTMRCIFVATRP